MHPHSALDPSFLGSFKRLFSQKGCSLDLDMTRRIDWHARRSVVHPSFLDDYATKPGTCELTILCPELRSLCSNSSSSSNSNSSSSSNSSSTSTSTSTSILGSQADPDICTLHIRQSRPITVRDVLTHLDRFLYAEVPAAYWPECPRDQERIECAHRLRVKHLARTHGRSARAGARMSMSVLYHNNNNNNNKGSVGVGVGAPMCFMQVVECAEVDEKGRMVRRDRKVAPRIDWLGGKFFFAGLRKAGEAEGVDFVLNMEAPWARRRRSLS